MRIPCSSRQTKNVRCERYKRGVSVKSRDKTIFHSIERTPTRNDRFSYKNHSKNKPFVSSLYRSSNQFPVLLFSFRFFSALAVSFKNSLPRDYGELIFRRD